MEIMEGKLNDLVDEQGQKISPILPEGIKNYLIDIDGTITEDVPNEEPWRMATCEPYPEALATLQRWAAEGHRITYFTSRLEEHREVTETWLKKHGFPFFSLVLGKPRGGNYHWIDNHIVRATRYEGRFTDLVKQEKIVEVFED